MQISVISIQLTVSMCGYIGVFVRASKRARLACVVLLCQ